jgi:hypothetical protein
MAYEDPEMIRRKKRRQEYMNEFLGSDLPSWARERGGFQLSEVAKQSPKKRRTWLARGNVREKYRNRRQQLLDTVQAPMRQRQEYLRSQMPLSDREKMEATFGQQDKLAILGLAGRQQASTTDFRRQLLMNQVTNQQRTGAAALANQQDVGAAALLRQQKLADVASQRAYEPQKFLFEQQNRIPTTQYDLFEPRQGGPQQYLPRGGDIPPGVQRVSPSPIDITFGPTERPSPTERAEIRDARYAIAQLDNLEKMVDSSFVGPIEGRLDPIIGLLGGLPQNQYEFYAASAAFKNMIIKLITGAQVRGEEEKRILAQVPKPEDPYPRFLANLNQSRQNVTFLLQEQMRILRESGLMVPGETPLPWDAQPEDLGSMSTEQMLQMLRQLQ